MQLEQHAITILLLVTIALATLGSTVTIVVLATLWRREYRKGPFCGHCGKPLNKQPSSALAFEDQSLLSYECRCGGRTLLPDDPAD